MPDNETQDHYETPQISANAEPETIHRVFRLFAQRFHPDNQETGNASRFRLIHEAYRVLSDPEKRAQYRHRPPAAATAAVAPRCVRRRVGERLRVRADRPADADRGALHAAAPRADTAGDLISAELENLIGRPPEHLGIHDLVLRPKKMIQRGDNSQLLITADGMDYLEQSYLANLQRRRLSAPSVAV